MAERQDNKENRLFIVVNLHGQINVPERVRTTLIELGIGRRFAATVVPADPATLGSLRACKDYVAWSSIDGELLATLLKARGRSSNSKLLDTETLSKLGFKDHGELASRMVEQGRRLSHYAGIKPFIGLAPPKGGFKRSTRRQFNEGGVLGENPRLPELVRRML